MDEPASAEVQALLNALADATGDRTLHELRAGALARLVPGPDLARWADSGAMALTGRSDGPPLALAAPVASRLCAAAAVLAELSARGTHSVDVDAPALLGERAALRDLGRNGSTSVGGGCRLLSARDGWVACSLNRPDDWELLPALFRTDVADWSAVETAMAATRVSDLTSRAGELGLAFGALASGTRLEDEQAGGRRSDLPWVITAGGRGMRASGALRVLDLSALWAGPLCASLLRSSGADVTTVESTGRPDGARRGDPALHRLLHAGHTMALLDLRSHSDVGALHEMLMDADIVITAARPRALHQLGLDPFAWLERKPRLTWVAITAYGLTGPWSNRVGYGDDTAVAGGLVIREPTPMFCADAVADPVTGIYAAVAALGVAHAGGGVIDVAMRDAAAHVARPTGAPAPAPARRSGEDWVVEVDDEVVPVRPPRAREMPNPTA